MLLTIDISHARALYSIEFCFADGSSTIFGSPHPRSKSTDILIDADGGEVVTGFQVRAGKWIDAIKVVTNRKESGWLGHIGGGKSFLLIPPYGYIVIGLFGEHGRCCESFGVLYTSHL